MTNNKKAFVRTLWGIYDNKRYYQRRAKMDNDIKLQLMTKPNVDFTTYVFGKDNLKFLEDKGVTKLRLLDDKPILWDMETQQFRHKLEVFDKAMEEYDEIVFLDWDTYMIKDVPFDFWDQLKKKQKIQALLRMYHRRKALWRKSEKRKVPCASFVYFADKNITEELIKYWEKMDCPWSEEIVMAKYLDDINGGWKGTDFYWENYEPHFFHLNEGIVYDKEKIKTKNICFEHYNSIAVNKKLKSTKNE
jgi:hypothetical protein